MGRKRGRMERKHIVIVEDVDLQRDAIVEYLSRAGFELSGAASGAELRGICESRKVDVAIVDLHLPDEDGLDLVRFLRDTQRCGIIVLTANDDPTDRIVGLEVGADDFVTKPHPPRELLARIRSILRRLDEAPAAEAKPALASPISETAMSGWRLDVSVRCLRGPDNQHIDLTAAEYALMKELISQPGEALDREHLMRSVFHRSWTYEDRSMDVLVTRLRRKLEPIGIAHLIKSVRGTGYVLSTATMQ